MSQNISCLDSTSNPFVDSELLIVKELSRRDYVGCPSCSKRLDVANGRELQCRSPRCNGRTITAELLPQRTFLASDSQRLCLLDFVPFCFKLLHPDELIASELSLKAVKKKVVSTVEYGSIPALVPLDCAVFGEIGLSGSPQITLVSENTQNIYRLLVGLYNRQWSDNLRKGFAFELLGVVARQGTAREYDGFSFEWTGVNSYLGKESDSNADFVDSYKGIRITDQFKNTSGSYQPSRFETNPNANHYTLASVVSEQATVEWFNRQGRTVTITGRQVKEFPFALDGQLKPRYVEAVRAIKDSIVERFSLR
jgi:hypothetical protein